MADIATIIQTTPEGPTFALRRDVYRPGEAQELLADLVALANSAVPGKRYIVFGVESVPGSTERRVPGVPDPPNVQMWHQLVREYVEPEIRFEYRSETLASRSVGVLVIPHCAQPPYILKRTLGSLERGNAFIRRGANRDRLLRADLEAIYSRRFDPSARFAKLSVGFDAPEPTGSLALPRQTEESLPSFRAVSALRELIDARRYVDTQGDAGDSGIVRMVHVRLYGGDLPYERKALVELENELAATLESYRARDYQARYDGLAARVNLAVVNGSDEALEEAVLVAHFPIARGFDVVIPGNLPASQGRLDGKRETAALSVARSLGTIESGARVAVFSEALRVVITSECRHRVLPVRYELRAANLPAPLHGKLKFEVA